VDEARDYLQTASVSDENRFYYIHVSGSSKKQRCVNLSK